MTCNLGQMAFALQVCGGFSGPDYSYNSIPRGGGFVLWYGVFHPVPVLAGHIQLLYNPYPNQQEGPIETYDYPLTMFAPTTSQIQQVGRSWYKTYK